MKSLIENGYAFMTKVSMVSVFGNLKITYWGCACPLKDIGPSYGMEYIGGKRIQDLVLYQCDSLDELEEKLLAKARARWPNL